jgi:hypothetical protein
MRVLPYTAQAAVCPASKSSSLSLRSFRLVGALPLVAALAVGVLSTGCGGNERKYEPKPAPSGKQANVPSVPTLPQKNKKEGDAYTIWGASHDLRSKVHNESVNGKKISLVGYIVKTNLGECKDDTKAIDEGCTPKCAVHKGGKADPTDCQAPVPTFYIADSKEEQKDVIAVMGWASNYAQIYDTIEEIDKQPNEEKAKAVKIDDVLWGVSIPNPLPAVGAKVKVTGTYGVTFTKATSGTATNPKYGIMTVETVEYLEPSPELATLPGMKPRKKK